MTARAMEENSLCLADADASGDSCWLDILSFFDGALCFSIALCFFPLPPWFVCLHPNAKYRKNQMTLPLVVNSRATGASKRPCARKRTDVSCSTLSRTNRSGNAGLLEAARSQRPCPQAKPRRGRRNLKAICKKTRCPEREVSDQGFSGCIGNSPRS